MEKDFESKFEESPRKQQTGNSIKKANNTGNSSPGPLSDYSPLKGPASIASFFAPPPQVSKVPSSSLASSPLKANSHIVNATSPHRVTAPLTPSRLSSTPLKPKVEDSESDLTLSEGNGEEEKDEKEIEIVSPAKNMDVKTSSGRGIPFNFNEEGSATSSDEDDDGSVENENEGSDTDISVIISLPSTDSSEPQVRPVLRRYVDFSNSEYESDGEEKNDENDIPIPIDSDDEDDHRIPVMVFNSKKIEIPDASKTAQRLLSPEKKKVSSPKKEIVPIEHVAPISVKPVELPLKRSIQEPEKQSGNQHKVFKILYLFFIR